MQEKPVARTTASVVRGTSVETSVVTVVRQGDRGTSVRDADRNGGGPRYLLGKGGKAVLDRPLAGANRTHAPRIDRTSTLPYPVGDRRLQFRHFSVQDSKHLLGPSQEWECHGWHCYFCLCF